MRSSWMPFIVLWFAASAVGVRAQHPPTPPAATDVDAVSRDTELDRLTKEVASDLRCVVCQGLSIQDSPSTLAQEMRGLIREQLASGRSPQQVKEYFVEKYGERVLLQPKAQGFNLLVYVLPVAMLVGGGAFVYTRARNWTAHAVPEAGEDEGMY